MRARSQRDPSNNGCLRQVTGHLGALLKLCFPARCPFHRCLVLPLLLTLKILQTARHLQVVFSYMDLPVIDRVLFSQHFSLSGCSCISRFTCPNRIPMQPLFPCTPAEQLCRLCPERPNPEGRCSEKCCYPLIARWVPRCGTSAPFMIHSYSLLMRCPADVDSCQ